MPTIRRNDGRPFARVNHDGAKVFLVMTAPDGYSGREAAWVLDPDEWDRLREAGDEQAEAARNARAAMATGCNSQMGH